jgi:predicted permease
VDLLLAICQGLGLALAAGIRPFLPALVAGAAASADLLIDFDQTDLEFLELPLFLLAVTLVLIAAVLLERRVGEERMEAGPLGAALAGIAIGLGALLFAGSIDDEGPAWPGLIGGIAAAVLASATVRALFRRTRSRLDPDARAALPVYANGVALLLAALSILLPPVSIVALGFLVWLLLSGRRRAGEKYAGLRILR